MWGTFLLALTGPIVIKALATLGMGIVTYTGLSASLAVIQGYIQSNLSGLPADAAALIFMAGIPQAIGIVLSALGARVTMTAVSKIQRLV